MTRSSQDEPVDETFADARQRRLDFIARRVGASLGLSGRPLESYIKRLELIFAPQETSAGTVLDPAQAQRAQIWQMVRSLPLPAAGVLLSVAYILVHPTMPWADALILLFLLTIMSSIVCGVGILRWRNGVIEVYAALPPPGCVIAADRAALAVNGIATPWDQIVLDTVSPRVIITTAILWRTPSCIDRVRLIVRGKPLMLDSSVLTNGQILLDTVCDKLDLSAHPSGQGDVNARDLPLYPAPTAGPLGRAPMGAAMTSFDKREEGFEKKFAHDEELRFKANARRNKLLGQWAAEKLGLSGDDAAAYAKEVVMADFEEAGDHDVFKKVRKDFDAKGVAQSDHQIRRTMDELMEKAVAEIKSSG
jgi:hypothetical protein